MDLMRRGSRFLSDKTKNEFTSAFPQDKYNLRSEHQLLTSHTPKSPSVSVLALRNESCYPCVPTSKSHPHSLFLPPSLNGSPVQTSTLKSSQPACPIHFPASNSNPNLMSSPTPHFSTPLPLPQPYAELQQWPKQLAVQSWACHRSSSCLALLLLPSR